MEEGCQPSDSLNGAVSSRFQFVSEKSSLSGIVGHLQQYYSPFEKHLLLISLSYAPLFLQDT